MDLTTLVHRLWRTSIGRAAAAAIVAGGMVSCEKPDLDRTPPCVELRLDNFQSSPPELSIFATDSSDIGCSQRTKINDGLELVEESEGDYNNFGLKRIELYENGRRVKTLRIDSGLDRSFNRRSLLLTHTQGDFTYHVIAYDRAGNKTESVPLKVSFREGFCFPDGLRDTERPAIVRFTYHPHAVNFAAIVDDDTGIKEVRLYEQGTQIHSERPSKQDHQYPAKSFYFRFDHTAQPHRTYRLVAEDFAGNVTRSPEIRPSEL